MYKVVYTVKHTLVCMTRPLFSLCQWVGKKVSGLVRIPLSSWLIEYCSVNQGNVMHFQIEVPASFHHHRALPNL